MRCIAQWLAPLRPTHQQGGQGLAEYALILALIAIVVIVALAFFGEQLASLIDTIGSRVDDAT